MIYRSSALKQIIFYAILQELSAQSFSHVTFPCFVLFSSLPQASKPYFQSIWEPGSCRQLWATSAVMRRASLCAGTMTAGASALWTTHSVIALRWIWGLWKPVCCKSDFPGTRPTKTLRSQVSVFLFALVGRLWLSHYATSLEEPKKTKTDKPWRGKYIRTV